LNLGLGHPAGHLLGVTLDTSDKGVGEAVSLGTAIDRCDDDNPFGILVFVFPSLTTTIPTTDFFPACLPRVCRTSIRCGHFSCFALSNVR